MNVCKQCSSIYKLQITALFLFSYFRKSRLLSWSASSIIFLLQMIPPFPHPFFFSSVDQIFSFSKYLPPFHSPFVGYRQRNVKDLSRIHYSYYFSYVYYVCYVYYVYHLYHLSYLCKLYTLYYLVY